MKCMHHILVSLTISALLTGCSSGQAPAEDGSPDVTEPAPDAAATEATSTAVTPSAAPTASPSASASAAEPAKIDGITNKRLSFAKGTSGATVEGSITGYETIDYLLNVKQGQSLNISLGTKYTATYFNLLEPGETDAAIYTGSTGENMYEGVAQKGGDYRIRVYMMRSAARRNEKADYRLEANVSG